MQIRPKNKNACGNSERFDKIGVIIHCLQDRDLRILNLRNQMIHVCGRIAVITS